MPRSPSSTTPAPLPVFGTSRDCRRDSLLFVDGHPFRISYTGGDGNDVVLTALAQPAFSISDVTVTEGNSGSVNAVFTVSTPHAPFQTVSVQFATVNGTAASPQDYTAHSGTLTFLPGTTSQTVTIAVHGDDTAEATEDVHRPAVRRARRRDDRRRGRRRHDRD